MIGQFTGYVHHFCVLYIVFLDVFLDVFHVDLQICMFMFPWNQLAMGPFKLLEQELMYLVGQVS